MDSEPLVTIITPTYNHENYISDCLESAIAQTYKNWELIVVNDGSTDNTALIVEEFIRKDNRIKLLNQENVGIFNLAKTYNNALAISSGKYIAVLEGDDLWINNKLEKQIHELEKNPEYVLSWARVSFFSNNREITRESFPDKNDFDKNIFNNYPVGNILNRIYINHSMSSLTLIYKKSELLKIGGFAYHENLPTIDYPTIIKLATMGPFCFVDEILGLYRTYLTQTTKIYTTLLLESVLKITIDHYKNLEKNIKEQVFINEKDIKKHFRNRLINAYSRAGRYNLIRKKFKEARKDYIKAIFGKGDLNVLWRIRAIIGFIMSLFKSDVEGIAKLLGKQSY